ncbi:hypothetical protein U9M48_014584 [Paspalum notatum var. saurae]|uniref:NAC domain-containing protein n=1 Tax=Paspalum notatum var. saurae TaxID=547442 RepID=A0AAQ3T209_PASNO
MAGAEADEEYPIGFRFKPKDEELVECYLLPMLQHGRPAVRNRFVVEANVYAVHPDVLTNEYRLTEDQQEWFFLSPRTRMYPNGTRPKRTTLDKCGRWKASTAAKEVPEEVVHNGIRFTRGVLNYFVGPNNNGKRTRWIMLELTIPDYEIKLDGPGPKHLVSPPPFPPPALGPAAFHLNRYVAYKIYVSPQGEKKADDADEEEGTSSTACEENGEAASSSSAPHSPGTPGSNSKPSSDKQAGKRPMVVEPQQIGPARPAQKQKVARQGSPSIALAPAQARFSAPTTSTQTQVCYRVPEQPPTLLHRDRGLQNQQLFGQTTAAVAARPPDPSPANQTAVRMPCYPRNPYPPPQQQHGQHPGTGRVVFRPQVSLRCHYGHNYRPPQPPATSTSSTHLPLQPQPTHRPFLHGGASLRAGAGVVPRGTTYNNSHAQERGSLMTPAAADGRGGAAAGVGIGAPRFNVNAEQFFEELAKVNPLILAGAATGLMEPAPGAGKVETGTGQASGSNKQDAHAAA